MNIVYPSAFELYQINADLANRGKEGRLGLQLFPEVSKKTFEVRWWQKDNSYGLMNCRGIDGRPGYVERLGQNQFTHKPGVFGDYTTVTEGELLQRASMSDLGTPMNVDDYVMDATNLLTQRRLDREEKMVWDLCQDGTVTIPVHGPTGQASYTVTYSLQTYTAATSWGTTATATPILDLQAIQQKGTGHGAKFDDTATIYVNQFTANNLINNANATDFGGKRLSFGQTVNSLKAFSDYFRAQGMPGIEVYDAGYQPYQVNGPIATPATQFIKFLRNNKGVLIGRRPNNEPVGHIQQVINGNNPGNAAGPYTYVKNFGIGDNAPKETPPRIEIHHGFNGGIAIEFPSAVMSLAF